MVLLTLNLLLGAVIVVETRARPHHAGTMLEQPAPQATPELAELTRLNFALAPLSHYDEILDRPLFVPGRNPPEEASAARPEPVQQPIVPPTFTLAGIVIANDASKALLLKPNGKELVHVLLGESIDGWTIQTIAPDRIELAKGEKTAEIVLERVPDHAQNTALPRRPAFRLQDTPP